MTVHSQFFVSPQPSVRLENNSSMTRQIRIMYRATYQTAPVL